MRRSWSVTHLTAAQVHPSFVVLVCVFQQSQQRKGGFTLLYSPLYSSHPKVRTSLHDHFSRGKGVPQENDGGFLLSDQGCTPPTNWSAETQQIASAQNHVSACTILATRTHTRLAAETLNKEIEDIDQRLTSLQSFLKSHKQDVR